MSSGSLAGLREGAPSVDAEAGAFEPAAHLGDCLVDLASLHVMFPSRAGNTVLGDVREQRAFAR